MENIVEKIHREFHSSTDELVRMSEELRTQAATAAASFTESVDEVGEMQRNLGFTNTPAAQKSSIVRKRLSKHTA